MMIVIQKGVNALLHEREVVGVEGGMPQFLPTQGAVEGFDERLLVFLVESGNPMALAIPVQAFGTLGFELAAAVGLQQLDLTKDRHQLLQGDFALGRLQRRAAAPAKTRC